MDVVVWSSFGHQRVTCRVLATLAVPLGSVVTRELMPPRCTQQQQLEGKYSLESTDPRESEIRAPRQVTIALKLSCYLFIIAKLFKVKDGCLKFVYIGKNPRFTAFLDSNLHTRLAIVTENELGLAFPPSNLPKKFVQIRPRFI